MDSIPRAHIESIAFGHSERPGIFIDRLPICDVVYFFIRKRLVKRILARHRYRRGNYLVVDLFFAVEIPVVYRCGERNVSGAYIIVIGIYGRIFTAVRSRSFGRLYGNFPRQEAVPAFYVSDLFVFERNFRFFERSAYDDVAVAFYSARCFAVKIQSAVIDYFAAKITGSDIVNRGAVT